MSRNKSKNGIARMAVLRRKEEFDMKVRLPILGIMVLLALSAQASINNGVPFAEMKRVILNNELSFSKQITTINTIYVLQCDFELDKDVVIPTNCVLQFDGGRIVNNGKYTLTGQHTMIDAGQTMVFDNKIKLSGSWDVDRLNIRWFGVNPNDNTIDCSPIINNIKNCNIPIYFPKGTYYLSELYYQNTKDDSFAIIGEEAYGLSAIVNFMPFNTHQRYIIKIGGGSDTLGGRGRGYNIKIKHINFTTPHGYTPSKLTNSYTNSDSDYMNGGLILDVIEIGQFAVSGSKIHNMPFLTIGYIYECEFDYIICYGNHGKSIQPAVQIVNSQSKPYSALHVKKMMGEVLVGPMIKAVGRCAGSELVIDNFYFEGTVNWERESITSETRYTDTINFSDYNIVPIFDLEGCGFTIIDAELSVTNTKWTNSLDGNSKICVRGLLHFNNTLKGVNILKLQNNGGARWMYVTGTALSTYPIDVYIGQTNCKFQIDTRYVNLKVKDNQIIDEMKAIPLTSNYLYAGRELNDIVIPYFIKNRGTSNYIQQIKSNSTEVHVLYDSYMFNEYGFELDENVDCIYLEYYINTVSTCDIVIEYYDKSLKLLTSEKKKIIADRFNRKQVISINPPYSAESFKLKYGINGGHSISIYKFGVFDCEHVPVKRIGGVRPANSLLTPGFRFFDTNLNKPIFWTGDTSKGDNGWVDSNGRSPNL